MLIQVLSAKAEGKTEISSFDSALNKVNIHDYNLIGLSSVIPAKSKIVNVKYFKRTGDVGDRLYLVFQKKSSSIPGNYIGAALSWYQFDDGSGVFVEHAFERACYSEVKTLLENHSIKAIVDLCRTRKKKCEEKKIHIKKTITHVLDNPRSVLVAAVYKSEAWEGSI